MQKNPTFETGYESRLPFGSDFKILKSMVEIGRAKNEGGYLSYALQIYSHIPLAIIKAFKAGSLLDDLQKEILKLPNVIKRIQLLNKIYLACRCFDNVIDGDSPILLSTEELKLYAHVAENHFISEKWDRNFVPDKYFSEGLKIAEEISLEIKNQVLMVIKSMRFDAERRSRFLKTGEIEFISEADLKEHYYQLDIEGTIGAMLVLVDEENNEENRKLVQPLGEVMRIYYDIRDLKKETKQGLCNISKEDAQRFKITQELLTNWANSDLTLKQAPSQILNWAKTKMQETEILLATFYENLNKSKWKKLVNLFLENHYIRHYEKFKKNNGYLLN